MIKTKMPKWATPDRQTALANLWALFGNKCLLGHSVCPNPEHYVYLKPVIETVGKSVKLLCKDRQGNTILDSKGNQMYLTLYYPQTITIHKPTISRLYDFLTEQIIEGWKASDRELDKAQWQAEQRAMHNLGERTYPLRGQFSAISREVFADNQPLYYLQGQAVSGLTLTPFVKVRLASSYIRLFIDLGEALRQVSKSKRRKAIRYGKPLPREAEAIIRGKVYEAVKDYLTN